MNFSFSRRIVAWLVFTSVLLSNAHAVSARFKTAAQARLEKDYVVVVFASGSRTIVPLRDLGDEDKAFLTQLAEEKPLAHGKSQVTVAKTTATLKQTIVVSKTEGTVETVQLCPPNVPRDQLGGTCMAYARVHWLDIAGYGTDLGKLYQIINAADPDHPWNNPAYHQALQDMIANNKPVLHRMPGEILDSFEWARGELRQGRPILAALPREIWQALPPGFVAQRPWSGGSVGHQVVVNGFTWDAKAKRGTFHIINSWNELPEFDLTTEAASHGNLVFEQSMSPRGAVEQARAKTVVMSITLVRAVGKTNLYDVETNLGHRKVAAVSENAARELVEKED
jgi:hypothetical protein